MFNPSYGGTNSWQADRTINTILKAVDAGWFDNENEGIIVQGVHIRNLFTYRSSKPADLVAEYTSKLMQLTCKILAHQHLGLCYDDNTLEMLVPREWEQTAEQCQHVIVAWGNCGERTFQDVKNEVKCFHFVLELV